MKQKAFILGTLIFILGGIVGGLVFTRHYGVGPLAALQGTPSSANAGCEVTGAAVTSAQAALDAGRRQSRDGTYSVSWTLWEGLRNALNAHEACTGQSLYFLY